MSNNQYSSDLKEKLKKNFSVNTFRNFDSSTNLISTISPRFDISKSTDFRLPNIKSDLTISRKRSNSALPQEGSNWWIGNSPQKDLEMKQRLIARLKSNHKVTSSKAPGIYSNQTPHGHSATMDTLKAKHVDPLQKQSRKPPLAQSVNTSQDWMQEKYNFTEMMTIELFIKMCKEDPSVDQFVQAINSNPKDKFDLKLCPWEHLKKQQEQQTVSGKSVTLQQNREVRTSITHDQFLFQKKCQQRICTFPFIKTFHLIKTVKHWKYNMVKGRRTKAKRNLANSLFWADEGFRKHLWKHLVQCGKLGHLMLLNIDMDKTNTPEAFRQLQLTHALKINKVCVHLSEEMVVNYTDCIKEKITQAREKFEGELQEIKELGNEKDSYQQKMYNESIHKRIEKTKNIYHQEIYSLLGMPDNMLYGQRYELMQSFQRYIRLSIFFDLLTKHQIMMIYKNSLFTLQDLILRKQGFTHHQVSSGTYSMELVRFNINLEVIDQEVYKRNFQALLELNLQLNEYKIEDCDLYQTKFLSEFNINHDSILDWQLVHIERSQQEVEDIGLTSSLQILISKMMLKEESNDFLKNHMLKNYRHLQRKAVSVQPSVGQIKDLLVELLLNGLKSVLVFPVLSRSAQVAQFVDPIKEQHSQLAKSLKLSEEVINPAQHVTKLQGVSIRHKLLNRLLDANQTLILDFTDEQDKYFNMQHQCQDDLQQFDKILLQDIEDPAGSIELALKKQDRMLSLMNEELCGLVKCGWYQLNLTALNHLLVKKVKECRANVLDMAPSLYNRMQDSNMLFIQQCNQMLELPANNIFNYLQLRDNVDTINRKLQIVSSSANKMSGLIDFMDNSDIINYNPLLADILNNSQFGVERKVNKLENNDQEARFKKELSDQLIPQLMYDFSTYDTIVRDNDQLKSDIDREDAKQNLKLYVSRISEFRDKAKTQEVFAKRINYTAEEMTKLQVLKKIYETEILVNMQLEYFFKLDQFWELIRSHDRNFINDMDIDDLQHRLDQFIIFINPYFDKFERNEAVFYFKSKVSQYLLQLPALYAMKNSHQRNHHQEQISTILGQDVLTVMGIDHFVKLGLLLKTERLKEVHEQANQEHMMKVSIEEMLEKLNELTFEFVHSELIKTDNFLQIIDNLDTLLNEFEDASMELNNFYNNKYSLLLRNYISLLSTNVSTVIESLDLLKKVQTLWLYFEPILNIVEISKIIPDEQEKFKVLNEAFKQILRLLNKKQQVVQGLISSNLNAKTEKGQTVELKNIHKELEVISASVDKFMVVKRSSFPRFQFLSNDQILKLLSNADQLDTIMPILKILFPNIAELLIHEEQFSIRIYGVQSLQGERISFPEIQLREKQADQWMGELDDKVKGQISKSIWQFLSKPPADFEARLALSKKSLGQVDIMLSNVELTTAVEEILNEGDKQQGQQLLIEEMEMNLNKLALSVQNMKDQLLRVKTKNLIISESHGLNVVKKFNESKLHQVTDFQWKMYVKWRFSHQDELHLNEAVSYELFDHKEFYGMEQVGCYSRIVLSFEYNDMTVALFNSQAYRNLFSTDSDYGISLAQDWTSTVGCIYNTYSCMSNVDARQFSYIMTGCLVIGEWFVVDNIDQLNTETFSVMVKQLIDIKHALEQRRMKANLFGIAVVINQKFQSMVSLKQDHSFIQIDNSQFRSYFSYFKIKKPDLLNFMEVMLQCHGFNKAADISKRLNAFILNVNQEPEDQKAGLFMNERLLSHVIKTAHGLVSQVDMSTMSKVAQQHIEFLAIYNVLSGVLNQVPSKDSRNVMQKFLDKIFEDKRVEEFQFSLNNWFEEKSLILRAIMVSYNLHPNKQLQNRCELQQENFESDRICALVGKTDTFKNKLTDVLVQYYRLFWEIRTKILQINPALVKYKNITGYQDSNKQQVQGIIDKKLTCDNVKPRMIVKNFLPSQVRFAINFTKIEEENDEDEERTQNLIVVDCDLNDELLKLIKNAHEASPYIQDLKVRERNFSIQTESLAHISPSSVLSINIVQIDSELISTQQQIDLRTNRLRRLGFTNEQVELVDKHLYWKQIEAMKEVDNDVQLELSENLQVNQLFDQFEALFVHFNLKSAFDDAWCNTFICYSIIMVVGATSSSMCQNSARMLQYFIREFKSSVGFSYNMDCLSELIVEKNLYREKLTPNISRIKQPSEFNPSVHFSDIVIPTNTMNRNLFILGVLHSYKHDVIVQGDKESGKTLSIKHYVSKNLPISTHFTTYINANKHINSTVLIGRMTKLLVKTKKDEQGSSTHKKLVYVVDDVNAVISSPDNKIQLLEFFRQLFRHKAQLDSEGERVKLRSEWNVLVDNDFDRMAMDCNRLFGRIIPLKFHEPKKEVYKYIYYKLYSSYMIYHGFHLDTLTTTETQASGMFDLYLKVKNEQDKPNCPFFFEQSFRTLMNTLDLFYCISAWFITDDKFTRKFMWLEFNRAFGDRIGTFNTKGTQLLQEVIEQVGTIDRTHCLVDVFSESKALSVLDWDEIPGHFETILGQQNLAHTEKLNLSITDRVCKHLIRAFRIVKAKQRHAMLIGPISSGKLSLSKLACWIYRRKTISLDKVDDQDTLCRDLSEVLISCVDAGTKVLLLEDTNLLMTNYFDLIQETLSFNLHSGFIDFDMLTRISHLANDALKKDGEEITNEMVLQYLNHQVKHNFKIIMATNSFQYCMELFDHQPTAMKHIYINVIDMFTPDSHEEVAYTNMNRFYKIYTWQNQQGCDMDKTFSIWTKVDSLAAAFAEEQKANQCIQNLIDCMEVFKRLIEDNISNTIDNYTASNNVINVISDIESDTLSSQANLQRQEEELEEVSTQHQVCRVSVTDLQSTLEKKRIEIRDADAHINQMNQQHQTTLDDAEEILAKGNALFQTGLKALKRVTYKDLINIKNTVNVSEEVKKIIYSSIHLIDENQTKFDWTSACFKINSFYILQNMNDRKLSEISTNAYKRVKKLVQDNNSDEFQNLIKNKSETALLLYQWIVGIIDQKLCEEEAAPIQQNTIEIEENIQKEKLNLETLHEDVLKTRQSQDKINLELKNQERIIHSLKSQITILRQQISLMIFLSKLKSDQYEFWKSIQEVNKNNQENYLANQIIVAVKSTITIGMNTHVEKLFLEKLYSILDELRLPYDKGFKQHKQIQNQYYEKTLHIKEIPVNSANIERIVLSLLSPRFVQILDPDRVAKNQFKSMQKDNQVIMLNQTNLFADKSAGDRIREVIGRKVPIVIQNVPKQMDKENFTIFRLGRKLSMLKDKKGLETQQKGTSLELDTKTKFILIRNDNDQDITHEIVDSFNLVHIQLNYSGVTNMITTLLFSRLNQQIQINYTNYIKFLQQERQHLEKETFEIFKTFGENFDQIVQIPNFEENLRLKIFQYSKTMEMFNKNKLNLDKLDSQVQSIEPHSILTSNLWKVVYKLKWIDPYYHNSFKTFISWLRHYLFLQNEREKQENMTNRIRNLFNFSKEFYEQVYRYLRCQMFAGQREVLGLLMIKARLEGMSVVKPVDQSENVFSEESDEEEEEKGEDGTRKHKFILDFSPDQQVVLDKLRKIVEIEPQDPNSLEIGKMKQGFKEFLEVIAELDKKWKVRTGEDHRSSIRQVNFRTKSVNTSIAKIFKKSDLSTTSIKKMEIRNSTRINQQELDHIDELEGESERSYGDFLEGPIESAKDIAQKIVKQSTIDLHRQQRYSIAQDKQMISEKENLLGDHQDQSQKDWDSEINNKSLKSEEAMRTTMSSFEDDNINNTENLKESISKLRELKTESLYFHQQNEEQVDLQKQHDLQDRKSIINKKIKINDIILNSILKHNIINIDMQGVSTNKDPSNLKNFFKENRIKNKLNNTYTSIYKFDNYKKKHIDELQSRIDHQEQINIDRGLLEFFLKTTTCSLDEFKSSLTPSNELDCIFASIMLQPEHLQPLIKNQVNGFLLDTKEDLKLNEYLENQNFNNFVLVLRDNRMMKSVEEIANSNMTLALDDSILDLMKSAFQIAYNEEKSITMPFVSMHIGIELYKFNKIFIKPQKNRENFWFKTLINIEKDLHSCSRQNKQHQVRVDELDINEMRLFMNQQNEVGTYNVKVPMKLVSRSARQVLQFEEDSYQEQVLNLLEIKDQTPGSNYFIYAAALIVLSMHIKQFALLFGFKNTTHFSTKNLILLKRFSDALENLSLNNQNIKIFSAFVSKFIIMSEQESHRRNIVTALLTNIAMWIWNDLQKFPDLPSEIGIAQYLSVFCFDSGVITNIHNVQVGEDQIDRSLMEPTLHSNLAYTALAKQKNGRNLGHESISQIPPIVNMKALDMHRFQDQCQVLINLNTIHIESQIEANSNQHTAFNLFVHKAAQQFNEQVLLLKRFISGKRLNVSQWVSMDAETASFIRQIENQLTPPEFRKFMFDQYLDFQKQIRVIIKNRNHLQKLVKQPERRVLRPSAFMNRSKILNMFRMDAAVNAPFMVLKEQIYVHGFPTPQRKASDLMEQLNSGKPISELNPQITGNPTIDEVLFLKSTQTLNGQFKEVINASNTGQIFDKNCILMIMADQKKEYVANFILQNLLTRLKMKPNKFTIYNCPIFYDDFEVGKQDHDYIQVKSYGNTAIYSSKGVCINFSYVE